MTTEVINRWEQYEPIIGGVLKTGHIDWRNEILMIISRNCDY